MREVLSPARHAARLLGRELVSVARLSGGDLSAVLRIVLADGRTAVVKGGPDPLAEAAMLDAMRAAGVPAPAVLAADAAVLVLEELPAGGSHGAAWADLGRVLARLHQATGDGFGWPVDYAFGRVVIANGGSPNWPAFWSERRLLNQLTHLPADLAGRLEQLARGLSARLPQRPTASLLHGDLWSGNVLVRGSQVTGLIDPACYYGDREVDLAMLRLFAAPGPAFTRGYGSLEPEHEERLPIYQLWPAIVHLRLFGPAYRSLVERLLRAAGH